MNELARRNVSDMHPSRLDMPQDSAAHASACTQHAVQSMPLRRWQDTGGCAVHAPCPMHSHGVKHAPDALVYYSLFTAVTGAGITHDSGGARGSGMAPAALYSSPMHSPSGSGHNMGPTVLSSSSSDARPGSGPLASSHANGKLAQHAHMVSALNGSGGGAAGAMHRSGSVSGLSGGSGSSSLGQLGLQGNDALIIQPENLVGGGHGGMQGLQCFSWACWDGARVQHVGRFALGWVCCRHAAVPLQCWGYRTYRRQ